jgi:hypothetical protein
MTSIYIRSPGVTKKNVLVPKEGEYDLKIESRRGFWQVRAQQTGGPADLALDAAGNTRGGRMATAAA